MKREEINRNTRLGVFVIVSVLLFLLAVFLLGSEQSLFSANIELRANFTDVNGLQKGNNVWLAGVKVGTVRDVSIIDNSKVQVAMRIDADLHPYIKKDATASISSEGFVGNTIVVIHPGSSNQVIEENDILASGKQTSTQDMLDALQTTADNINSITNELREMMYSAVQEGTVGALLTDTTLGQEIRLTIDNIQNTTRRSANLTANLAQTVNELRKNESGLVHTLVNDTTFAGSYEQTLANLQAAGETAAQASTQLNEIIQKIDNNNNATGVILNDSTFANDIQETASELSEGMEKFNENMEALRHNFLFRRYFRRQERQQAREAQAADHE